mmetsp:Transcript_43470/g.116327  ORF Transcript_43470/g.116327 Transcript_43470/m.116327 type:complete len:85 (+) Transcript_43470:543-797(+)
MIIVIRGRMCDSSHPPLRERINPGARKNSLADGCGQIFFGIAIPSSPFCQKFGENALQNQNQQSYDVLKIGQDVLTIVSVSGSH